MKLVVALLTALALLSGCASTNTRAINTNEVAIGVRDFLFFCTFKAETNPQSCTDIVEAQPGDICLVEGSTVSFKSLRQRTNQFLIVPIGENPFRSAAGGPAGCAVISEDGLLSCRVEFPTTNTLAPGEYLSYKYWVFGQGCGQSLDPRVFIIKS